jgi:hypothetical protein
MNVRFSDLLEFFSPFFPVIVGESFQTLAHLHAISSSIESVTRPLIYH